MNIVAIIPARGGSVGVPRKNIREILGKPMIAYSIEQALAAKQVSRVIVSTDNQEIADIAIKAGADVPALRPAELAQADTLTEPVLIHAVQEWCDTTPDAVMLLQPTSPIRLPGSLDKAIDTFLEQQADSLVSVTESHPFFWQHPDRPKAKYDVDNRPRRQDLTHQDAWFRENGSIYITKTEILLRKKNRLGGKVAMFEMEDIETVDVDSEVDLIIVEELLRWRNKW